jgi:hypothetical protein
VDDHVLHLRPRLRSYALHEHDPLCSRSGGC